MPSDIEIALLSNNGILREGLRHILGSSGFRITAAASNPDEIVFPPAGSGEAGASIIILDESATDRCLELCEKMRDQHPDAKLVVLADRFDFDFVIAAFRRGIDGYLVKEISSEPLVGALRLIAMGER